MTKHLAVTLLAAMGLSLTTAGCDTDLLVNNPNAPTPEVLLSDEGIRRLSTGIFNQLGGDFLWRTLQYHEGMADLVPSRVGNWAFVDMVNPQNIDYSVAGVPDNTPQAIRGFTSQPSAIEQLNTRLNTDNPVQFEWGAMYRVLGESNRLLVALNDPNMTFLGTAAEQENKKKGYLAWAYFWKGYAYSRIGLMYEQGLIVDEPGTTNNAYKTSAEMVAESNRQLDLAIQNAAGISAIVDNVVPAIFGTRPTATSFAQLANTIKARNLVSIKYRSDMTAADWQAVKTAADAGLRSNANTLQIKVDDITFIASGWLPYRAGALGAANAWAYVSQRLVQEFSPGDKRIHYGTRQTAPASAIVSVRDSSSTISSANLNLSGVNYFARGNNSLSNAQGNEPVFEYTFGNSRYYIGSAEEAMLTSAEASLALGDAAGAAALIDQVRTMQGAGLPALAPASVTPALILRERRIALVMRGVGYYDYRRYKITLPLAQGGGRTGAHVFYTQPGSIFKLDKNATINYNFRPFWPVPKGETDLNPGTNPTPS